VHYSVAKAAHILGLSLPSHVHLRDTNGNNAPDFIASDTTGAIDCDNVVKWAAIAHAQGHPLLFALTAGTTFRGATDPILSIIERLPHIFSDNSKRHAWIHVDGAISANLLPWLEQAQHIGAWSLPQEKLPQFDFRIPAISSICCSPYKWMGAPFPFGIYLTRGHYRLLPPTHPRYIGCVDSTLSGSRSGLACVYAWNYIRSRSSETHMRDIITQQHLITYAYKKLQALTGTIRTEYGLFEVFPVNPGSPIIYFTQPPEPIVEKFSLACEDGLAHIVILNHVNQSLIDLLIATLKEFTIC
jgi:histidine decarboxylase